MANKTLIATAGTSQQNDINAAIATMTAGDTLTLSGVFVCDIPIQPINGINITSDPINRATLKIKPYAEQRASGICGTGGTGPCCGITYWRSYGRGLMMIGHATVSNLIFDGSLGKQYLVAGQGCMNLLELKGSVTVDNCIFKDGINDAIMVEEGNNRIINNQFLNIIHDCVAIGKGNGYVTKITSNNDYYENNYANNWEIVNEYGGATIGWHNSMFRLYNATNQTFRYNTSDSPNSQLPWELCPGGTWQYNSHILIEHNVIKNCILDAGIDFLDLQGQSSAAYRTDIKILDNVFINNKGYQPGGAIAFKQNVQYNPVTKQNYVIPGSWNNIEIARNTFTLDNKAQVTVQAQTVIDTVNTHDNYTTNTIPPGQGSTIQDGGVFEEPNNYEYVNGTCVQTATGTQTLAECLAAHIEVRMIQNGTFDTNTEFWTLDLAGSTGSVAVLNGEARVNITALNQWARFYQSGMVLKSNTNYMVKFDAYSTVAKPIGMEFYVHDNVVWPPNLISVDIPLTTTKQTFEFPLNLINAPANIQLRFKFIQTGTYIIDNVSITEENTPPPPPTGEYALVFEDHFTSLSGYDLIWNNPSAFSVANSILNINIASGTNPAWMRKTGFTWQYGLLRFRAKFPTQTGVHAGIWGYHNNGVPCTNNPSWTSQDSVNFETAVSAETYGPRVAGHLTSTFSIWSAERCNQYTILDTPNDGDAFHDYEMEWTPTAVICKIDGVERARWTTGIPQQPIDLSIGIDCLGNAGACAGVGWMDHNIQYPINMQVDSIQLYQKDTGCPIPVCDYVMGVVQ